jgi:outer membrane protein TolC
MAATGAEKLLLELKTALGLSAGAPLELTQSLESAVDSLRQRAAASGASYRPDVELTLLSLDRAGAETRLAKASAWEGIRVGVEYMQDRSVDAPAGVDSGNFLGVKVSLPLPVWDNKKGEIDVNQAAEEQRAAQVRALELELANGIAAAPQTANPERDKALGLVLNQIPGNDATASPTTRTAATLVEVHALLVETLNDGVVSGNHYAEP